MNSSGFRRSGDLPRVKRSKPITKAAIQKAIAAIKATKKAVTLTKLATALRVKVADLRPVLAQEQISVGSPAAPEIQKSDIQGALAKLEAEAKPVTITAVAIALKVSPARLRKAWEKFRFERPRRGRPPVLDRQEDDIDKAIRGWKGSDKDLAAELGITREAIRQRRERLGLPTEEARRKDVAMELLQAGGQPGVIAVQTGFDRQTVKRWLRQLQEDPICACARKAIHKAKPSHLYPSLCRKCAPANSQPTAR